MTHAYVATSDVRAFRRQPGTRRTRSTSRTRSGRRARGPTPSRTGPDHERELAAREPPEERDRAAGHHHHRVADERRCGSARAARGRRPPAQLIEAAHGEDQARQGDRRSRRPRASPRRRTRGPNPRRRERVGDGVRRSGPHSAIQSGTSAKISATVPLGIVRSASTTDPLPPAISSAPTVKRRPPLGPPDRVAHRVAPPDRDREEQRPRDHERVPAAISGGRVSFVIRIPR